MEEIKKFFFDTYALYEILHENVNYKPYSKGVSIITGKLNLMELHFILLRIYGEKIAEKAFERFNEFCVPLGDDIIKKSNKLKLIINNRDVSYVDCIGYIFARKLGAKFLTGDPAFEKMENVEFVK